MKITLLLDLDDTLLDTHTEMFLPAYYKALAEYLRPEIDPAVLLPALMSGIGLMLANSDPTLTLQQVFEADFYSRIGIPREQLSDSIDRFYAAVFPTLGSGTKTRPGARELVEWALSRGHQVALATDPVFPRVATLERVRWAGLEPHQFDLISTYETFHFTKNQPAYFAEFLGRLGWPDRPVLMAGNDIQRDLLPARSLGLATYHVNGAAGVEIQDVRQMLNAATDYMEGDLPTLRSWLASADLEPYVPAFSRKDAVFAMLRATPAVLHGLTAELSRLEWATEPSREDWAMVELVCHLRDTEREVHHAQISALLGEHDPFVPRPDAAVWAKQRKYLDEDGPAAVQELAIARLETLHSLADLPDSIWSKPARHAIFGPTNFGEVVGFMADHDRMHLQQAWNTLAALTQQAHRN